MPLAVRWAELVIKEGKQVESRDGEDLPYGMSGNFSHTLGKMIKYLKEQLQLYKSIKFHHKESVS